jgi:hypothetical protein
MLTIGSVKIDGLVYFQGTVKVLIIMTSRSTRMLRLYPASLASYT